MVFPLAGGWFAWIGEDALFDRLVNIFAVAQSDLDAVRMLGLALLLTVLHCLAKDLVANLLVLVLRAAATVREDHLSLRYLRTYG